MQFANTLQFGIFSIAYLIIVLQAYFSRVYSHLAKFIKSKHSFISQILLYLDDEARTCFCPDSSRGTLRLGFHQGSSSD